MRRIETELGEAVTAAQVGFVFVSIDPENDTPERLKAFAVDYRFDPARWSLLTADEDTVLELAVALGMRYCKTDVFDFAHSNIITVLAPDSRILHQQEGVGADPAKSLEVIRARLGGG